MEILLIIEVIGKAAMCFLVLMTIGTGFMYACFFNLKFPSTQFS